IVRLGNQALFDSEGPIEGIAQIPAPDRKVMFDSDTGWDVRAGATFPPILNLGEDVSQFKVRERNFPPIDSAAEAFLQAANDVLDVERQPAKSVVARMSEGRVPTHLPRNDHRVGDLGVEDRSAL